MIRDYVCKDPVELGEERAGQFVAEFGIDADQFRCPECGQATDYKDAIPVSNDPYSDMACHQCMYDNSPSYRASVDERGGDR